MKTKQELERMLHLSEELATSVPQELGSQARELNSSLAELYDDLFNAEWFNTSESMPPIGKKVWVWDKDYPDAEPVLDERIEENEWEISYDVTHWGFAYIPNPPKKDTKQKFKMDYQRLPKEKFGDLIQALYNTELQFTLEWMWDGGFDWSFSQGSFSGMKDYHENTKELVRELNKDELDWNRDIEMFGGVILFDYMQQFSGKDSRGNLNQMGKFIQNLNK